MTIGDEQLAKVAVSIVTAILSTRSNEARKATNPDVCTDCGGPVEVCDYSDAGFIVTQAFATYDLAKELAWWKTNVTDVEAEQPVGVKPLQIGAGGVKLVM